jgi:ATP-dependent DNA helicase RecQ
MVSFITPGTTIVISPLKSLMDDQIDNLKDKGFDHGGYIDTIHSNISKREKENVLKRFASGQLKILYISPERFRMQTFIDELNSLRQNSSINYLVIDEAHCISEWGHDFRASYLQLRQKSRLIGDPTIIALTATASKRVRDDICDILEIGEENIITNKTLSRPEISMQVIIANRVEDKIEKLKSLLSAGDANTDLVPIYKIIGYTFTTLIK